MLPGSRWGRFMHAPPRCNAAQACAAVCPERGPTDADHMDVTVSAPLHCAGAEAASSWISPVPHRAVPHRAVPCQLPTRCRSGLAALRSALPPRA